MCGWCRSPSNGRSMSIAGPRVARRAARRRRSAARHFQRSVPLSRRAVGDGRRRHRRRGCSASRSRANSPTSLRCRRRMATRRSARSWQAGQPYGIRPYGTEALGVMRIEKGHVAGNELNGQTTARRSRPRPHDVEQEGFYRPRHGGAAGAARTGAAALRRLPAGRSRGTACAPARISFRPAARRRRRMTRAT